GLTRHITDPEIRGMLTSGAGSAKIVQQIRALCFERGAEDNLTAVLVKATGANQQQPESQYVHIAPVSEPAASPVPGEKATNDRTDDKVLALETHELRLPDEGPYNPAAVQQSPKPAIQPIAAPAQ